MILHGACATMTIIVEVENEVELDGVSGSVRITGDTNLGGTLTADFSNISDEEGGSRLEELHTRQCLRRSNMEAWSLYSFQGGRDFSSN